jgi:uncharacterized protein YndB with AHSA1/START domain
MTLESLTIDQPINASPAQVWERITTPEGIARWWRPGDIAPVLGHEFTMDMEKWGMIPCRIIEVVPHERLAYTFGDFELHWTIRPTERGCILRLEQTGFDPANPQHRIALDKMGAGWRNVILPRLAQGLLDAA